MDSPNANDLHQLWAEFLKRWPIERLREMTLEEYTNLRSNTDDYFCHWVERKTESLGSIQGATSAKFGIYHANNLKNKLRSGLISDGSYVWWDQLGTTSQKAFDNVKSYVIKIAETSSRGDHSLLLHNHIGPIFQLKIRFLYQSKPYQILPIYAKGFINFCSEKYLQRSCKKYDDLIPANLELKAKNFPNEDLFKAASLLWEEYKTKDGTSPRRYWAGGIDWDGTSMQKEFIENNEWRLGWNEKNVKAKPSAQKFLNWYDEVQVRDYFAMKGYGGRNHLQVYYVGEVTDKDEDNNALSLKPLGNVPLFHGKAPKVGAGGSWFGSITPINNTEAIKSIFGEAPIVNLDYKTNPMNSELNQILYGPPGTGKTYKTVRKAVAIVDGTRNEASANRRFQELKRAGRIEFLTFHQSYSYEDFVEGIRPDIDEDGGARFTCQNGIFKQLATKATYRCLEEISDGPQQSFDDLWSKLCNIVDANP